MKRLYGNARVIKIINNQFPELKIDSVKVLQSEYWNEVFLINREYIFKFPKNQSASDRLYIESKLLLDIEGELPILIPKVEFLGTPSETFSMHYFGYKKIEGEPLTPKLFNMLDKDAQEQVAKDIVLFLKSLHSIKFLSIPGLELTKKDKYSKDYEVFKHSVFPNIKEELKDKITKVYEDILNDKATFVYKKSLIHNDLSSRNILFDRITNRICAVIDFGDAIIYDVDEDFKHLLEESKEEFGRFFGLKVLGYYNHSNIDVVIKKADFEEFYWPFEQVLMGKKYGSEKLYKEGIKKISKITDDRK